MKNLTFKSALLIINVLLIPLVSFSQGSIEGNVVDEFTNEVIPFINVGIVQNGEIISSTVSDYEGNFYFDNLQNGVYDIKLELFSNTKNYTDIELLNEDLVFSLEFNTATEIPIVDVPGHKDLISKERIEVIKSDFIENTGAVTITEIEELMPSTVATPEGVSYKGSRPGTGVYYIDGIRTYGDLYVPMSSVGSIEIYNGGVPAQYGNTTSAVIVVESKSYFDKH